MAITLARLNQFDELVTVVAHAKSLLKSAEGSIEDEPTRNSLYVLRDVLQSGLPDPGIQQVQDLLQQIDTLVPQSTPRPQVRGPGNNLIRALQIELDAGFHMVQHSGWEEGVDTVLRAANLALEQGAMVDDMIEGLLDTGLELMAEAIRRPMETPELLIDSVKRIVVWLDENSTVLRADQVSRHSILESFISDSSDALVNAVRALPPPSERTRELDAWEEVAILLNDQLAAMRRRQMFADLPPFLDVTYSLNGGEDLNVWWRESKWSSLELWVNAQGIITFTSSGQMDPMRVLLERAGLRKSKLGDLIRPADGWSANINGSGIEISDANGIGWVSVENVPDDILYKIIAQRGLVVIYGDLAVTRATDCILSGWVSLVGIENGTIDVRVEDSEGRSEPWWRRLLHRLLYSS